MIFIKKIPWNQSNTLHVNECLKINGDVHCCFQLGFSWIVYFSIKKNWRQAAFKTYLDFPVIVSPKMHQIASLGPYFFKMLPGSMLLDPPRLLTPYGHSMPVTGYFELGAGFSKITGEHCSNAVL